MNTLTRRDTFAAAALQGMLSGELVRENRPQQSLVKSALEYADELIAELDGEKKERSMFPSSYRLVSFARRVVNCGRLDAQTEQEGREILRDLTDVPIVPPRLGSNSEATCSVCNWTNTGCLNVGEFGAEKWVCHGCIKRRFDAAESPVKELATISAINPAALERIAERINLIPDHSNKRIFSTAVQSIVIEELKKADAVTVRMPLACSQDQVRALMEHAAGAIVLKLCNPPREMEDEETYRELKREVLKIILQPPGIVPEHETFCTALRGGACNCVALIPLASEADPIRKALEYCHECLASIARCRGGLAQGGEQTGNYIHVLEAEKIAAAALGIEKR